MQHILVALDGSRWSEVAVEYALEFARAGRRDVQALAVIPEAAIRAMGTGPEDPDFGQHVPEAEQLARRAINQWFATAERLCREAALCFERTIEVGRPAERLLWAAMTAHLVVFGRHGANAPAAGAGMGRVALRMLRSAIKPMLVTPAAYRPIRTVLLGWAGQPGAAHAAEIDRKSVV